MYINRGRISSTVGIGLFLVFTCATGTADAQTSVVSIAMDGTTPGNGVSESPSLSADGRYVVFQSGAPLVADDTNSCTSAGPTWVGLPQPIGGPAPPPYGQAVDLPANSRVNVPISAMFGTQQISVDFGVLVESNGPQIVVERAMYFSNGVVWAAGTAALATKLQ